MKSLIAVIAVVAIMTTTVSFNMLQDDPWKVPAKYEKMKNPVVSDIASIKSGKELYITYCLSCHGINGKGAGRRAVKLNTTPADFTSASFQSQTDGALLYKIYFGHKEMPGFKKRLPGHEGVGEDSFGNTRIPGDLVNFLRNYAKK
jgi:mono/diheme cytochrome c family protein